MYCASEMGHLRICRWLFDMGAVNDVTRESNNGSTPMFIACEKGHMSVCKWLFEVGAARDIFKANKDNETPMLVAFQEGHLEVCMWLVTNGSLSQAEASSSRNDHRIEILGHVYPFLFRPPVRTEGEDSEDEQVKDYRPKLLEYAQNVLATHSRFLHVVLRASVLLPRHSMAWHRPLCYLPLLPRAILQHVAGFLGVETKRRLRNVREFSEALTEHLKSRAGTDMG